MMIGIKHDMYRPQVNLTQAAKLLLLWVAIVVGAAVAVECLFAFLARPDLRRSFAWERRSSPWSAVVPCSAGHCS